METYTLTSPATPTLEEKKKERYILRKKNTPRPLSRNMVLIFVFVFLHFILFICPYRWNQVRSQLIATYLSSLLSFAVVTQKTAIEVFISLTNVIVLAFVTMIIGAHIGFLLGLMVARNLSRPQVCSMVCSSAGLIRTAPTIIRVLIFTSGFGLAATTAAMGISFHSVAYFIKSYSEAFEEVDPGAMRAMKVSRGSWWQVVWSAVILVSFTKLLSWTAMRGEMSSAITVIIGPAVSVPRMIGSTLNSYQWSGDYGTVGLCVLVIFMTALLFKVIVTLYKQKSIVNDQRPMRPAEALSGKEVNPHKKEKLFRCRLRRN